MDLYVILTQVLEDSDYDVDVIGVADSPENVEKLIKEYYGDDLKSCEEISDPGCFIYRRCKIDAGPEFESYEASIYVVAKTLNKGWNDL